jgi:transposase
MTKKHTSVEVKLEAVLQILDGKKSVIEVANDLNLHRDTVNRWVNAYKERGQNGLENPHSHRASETKNSHKRIKELEKKLKKKSWRMRYKKSSRPFSRRTNKQKV